MNGYNYDVKEMINNFSLEDFILSKNNKIEKEAILLITDNQYILSYSKDFGYGDCNEAMANSVREIYGLKDFRYRREIDSISGMIKQNFITANIINSKKAGVYLSFNLNDCKRISESQLELFKDFYDKYNDVIKLYSESFGYPIVKYSLPKGKPYVNDFGIVDDENYYDSDDLSGVYELLKSRVDVDKVNPVEDKIIGNVVKTKNKNKVNNFVSAY